MPAQRSAVPRHYTREFIVKAARVAIEAYASTGPAHRPLIEVSRELGIPKSTLYRWARELHPDKFGPYRPLSAAVSVNADVRLIDGERVIGDQDHGAVLAVDIAVQRDNQRLERENAILRAALTLLARQSTIPSLL